MVLHSTEKQAGGYGGGDDGGDGGGGYGSSIALLQERFRQLHKMREKRQEMKLLKLFPEPKTMSQTSQPNRYEPLVRPPVNPDTVKSRPRFQDSPFLGLNLYTKQEESKKPAKSTQLGFKKHEVDTSLHL